MTLSLALFFFLQATSFALDASLAANAPDRVMERSGQVDSSCRLTRGRRSNGSALGEQIDTHRPAFSSCVDQGKAPLQATPQGAPS